MKILVITPRFPYPPVGGDKLRIFHVARFLASRGHELGLLSLAGEGDEAPESTALTDTFGRISIHRRSVWRRRVHAGAGLFTNRPLQVAYFQSEGFRKQVDRELRQGGYDAVLCHLVRTAELVRRRTDLFRVCEMTDAISMYYADVIRQRRSGLRNLLYRAVEFRRMRRCELDIVEAFDRCVVVSEADREYVVTARRDLARKLEVIPISVDCDEIAFAAGPYDDRLIVFIGNMRTSRNCDACEHFADEILPLVRRAVPGARFKIVGADPQRRIRRLAQRPGVSVTGRVDDLRAEVVSAAVSVCPIRLGAGLQTKILESMAMGVPVVSSPVGVRALTVVPGIEVLVGHTPSEFAAHVIAVMRSASLRRRLARAGRERVERDYALSRCLERYDALFRERV